MTQSNGNGDPAREQALEAAKRMLEGMTEGVDKALSKIEKQLKKGKGLKDDEKQRLANLDGTIGSLEREVSRYGDAEALRGERDMIADMRRRFTEAKATVGAVEERELDEATKPDAPAVEAAAPAEQNEEEQLRTEAERALRQTKEFAGKMNRQARKLAQRIADGAIDRESAEAELDQIKQGIDELDAAMETNPPWAEAHGFDVAPWELLRTGIVFEAKAGFERAVEAYNARSKASEAPEEPAGAPGYEKSFAEHREEVLAEQREITDKIKQEAVELFDAHASLDPREFSRRFVRLARQFEGQQRRWFGDEEAGRRGVKGAFFSRDMTEGARAVELALGEIEGRLNFLRSKLPAEVEPRDQAAMLVAGRLWKPEVERGERWKMLERAVSDEGVPEAELAPLVVDERAFRKFMSLVAEHRDAIRERFAARKEERGPKNEIKNPVGWIVNGNFWKDGVDRNTREQVTDAVARGFEHADLAEHFVDGAGYRRFLANVAELKERLVNTFDERELAREREDLDPRSLVKDKRLWKERNIGRRWDIFRGLLDGSVSEDELASAVRDGEVHGFKERVERIRHKWITEAREVTLPALPGKIAALNDRLTALRDAEPSTLSEQIRALDQDAVTLWRSFEDAVHVLPDDEVSAADVQAIAEAFRKLRGRVDAAMERVRKIEEQAVLDSMEPAERAFHDVVANDDLWRLESEDDRRLALIDIVEGNLHGAQLHRVALNAKALTEAAEPFRALFKADRLNVPREHRLSLRGVEAPERIQRVERRVAWYRERLLDRGFWKPAVTSEDRARIIEGVEKREDAEAALDGIKPAWRGQFMRMMKRFVELKRLLADVRSGVEERDIAASTDVLPTSSDVSTSLEEATAAEEHKGEDVERVETSTVETDREKALREHEKEILALLADDVFWMPYAYSGNIGTRKARVKALLTKGTPIPRANLVDPELFEIVVGFRSIADLRGMVERARPVVTGTAQRAVSTPESETAHREPAPSAGVAASTDVLPSSSDVGASPEAAKVAEGSEGEDSERVGTSIESVVPVAAQRAVSTPEPEIARSEPAPSIDIAASTDVLSSASDASTTSEEAKAPEGPKTPDIERVEIGPEHVETSREREQESAPTPTPPRRKARVAVQPSLEPDIYFDRARALRVEEVEAGDEMRAEERASAIARDTRSWFGKLRDRLLGHKPEVEPERPVERTRAAAAAGMLGGIGRIFGYDAAERIAAQLPGMNAAERRMLRGTMERAGRAENASRSAEASLDQRVASNIAAAERLERSINASSMPEAEKKALRERLVTARRTYEQELARLPRERNVAVAQIVAENAAAESPTLAARGRGLLSGTSFEAFAEAFGAVIRERKDLGLIGRTVEAFRAGFAQARDQLTGGRPTPPPADAARTLAFGRGVESRLTPLDSAALLTGAGGDAAAAAAHERLQADVDALIAHMERR